MCGIRAGDLLYALTTRPPSGQVKFVLVNQLYCTVRVSLWRLSFSPLYSFTPFSGAIIFQIVVSNNFNVL